jgi:transcriptional regulator with XRE-family HTH domain
MPRVGNPKHRRRHFIRAWREHRGLTQEQLADRLGTTKANISRIENLRQGYTQDFLEACADALMTDPASLIMRDPSDEEAFWSIWDQAKPGQRRQIEAIVRALTADAVAKNRRAR